MLFTFAVKGCFAGALSHGRRWTTWIEGDPRQRALAALPALDGRVRGWDHAPSTRACRLPRSMQRQTGLHYTQWWCIIDPLKI